MPIAWLHHYRDEQKLGVHELNALEAAKVSEAVRMRDRGYRLRRMELRLTETGELTVVGRPRIRLIGLAAFRLLFHVRAALADFESTNDRSAAWDALEWWYAHLMALALTDDTVAAIHLVAFPDSGSDASL